MAETPEVNQRDLWITSPAHSYSSPLASRLPRTQMASKAKVVSTVANRRCYMPAFHRADF